MLVFSSAVLSALLLSFGSADAFSLVSNGARPAHTKLSVANDVTQEQEQQSAYEIARGDGSTGGGGLPMPNQEEDGLVRPKVSFKPNDGGARRLMRRRLMVLVVLFCRLALKCQKDVHLGFVFLDLRRVRYCALPFIPVAFL